MTELPGGWTLDDLAKIAGIVARTQPGLILDRDEVRDIAAVAVVECLYTEPEPTRDDLYRAARRAVSTANQREVSYAGLEGNVARAGRERRSHEYHRYWEGRSALVSPFEDELTDRIAVRQVMAGLTPPLQEALLALAEHRSYEAARAALGLSVGGWEKRLYKARLQARTLWHSPEPPAPQWAPDHPGRDSDRRGRNRGLLHLARNRWRDQRETA